jgi:hypothetical protein
VIETFALALKYIFNNFFALPILFLSMSGKPLSDLSLSDRDVTIQVQINRKWEYRGTTDGGDILHLDMVLAYAMVLLS